VLDFENCKNLGIKDILITTTKIFKIISSWLILNAIMIL